MLNSESFEWDISGDNLTGTFMLSTSASLLTSIWGIHSQCPWCVNFVQAWYHVVDRPQGIEVSGISLPSKVVTLKGFNGLKNGVVINSFDLPSNDPAGGIHLTIDSEVINVCFPCSILMPLSCLIYYSLLKLALNSAPLRSTPMPTALR